MPGARGEVWDVQPLLWLDTSTLGWWEEEGEGEGRSNLGEALALTAITHELLGLGVQQSMVGVISPYWAQVKRNLHRQYALMHSQYAQWHYWYACTKVFQENRL